MGGGYFLTVAVAARSRSSVWPAMIDISGYQGSGQFGPAYQFMLDNDAHAPGSVDRMLIERMVRLCSETADYLYEKFTPTEPRYEDGSRPEMEDCLRQAGADRGDEEERIERICGFCAELGQRGTDDLDQIRFGGTEEQIVQRGSDFCGELARVACVLAQIAGLPARMVMLADTQKAYWGHVIIEAARRGTETIYTTPGTFRAAAIANYLAGDWRKYDYTVCGANDDYRSMLEMSMRGWPGGIRWLHGEDEL